MKSFVASLLAAFLLISSPALAREIEKGDMVTDLGYQWVVVKNLDPIKGPHGSSYMYGEECWALDGSFATVLAVEENQVLVRYTPRKPPHVWVLCPAGTIFLFQRNNFLT
jgi:hypothetical protein